jgi:inorganic pyrophosphatase
LDVLIIMEEPAYPGCMVTCKIIGALKAKQSDAKESVQNDRFIAVPVETHLYKDVHTLKDLPKTILEEIEQFFISYNKQGGKDFQPKGWLDAEEATQLARGK